MFGEGFELPTAKEGAGVLFTPAPKKETHGIVIRACEEVFRAVEDRRGRHEIEAEVHMSYVEVREQRDREKER